MSLTLNEAIMKNKTTNRGKDECIMKRITDSELRELPFGSKIRVIWHNSFLHKKGEENYGVIFGDKVGWEDGKIDDVRAVAESMSNDWCMTYLM